MGRRRVEEKKNHLCLVLLAIILNLHTKLWKIYSIIKLNVKRKMDKGIKLIVILLFFKIENYILITS